MVYENDISCGFGGKIMFYRDFASGIQFHDCDEKEHRNIRGEVVQIYQQENKKWYICIAWHNDYCGSERESEIKICPYCGEILE